MKFVAKFVLYVDYYSSQVDQIKISNDIANEQNIGLFGLSY